MVLGILQLSGSRDVHPAQLVRPGRPLPAGRRLEKIFIPNVPVVARRRPVLPARVVQPTASCCYQLLSGIAETPAASFYQLRWRKLYKSDTKVVRTDRELKNGHNR